VSEPGESNIPLSLDVVKARIFYLASDVEEVSATAAKLLRAVAESVDESAVEDFIAPAKSNGATEKVFSQVSAIRSLDSRARVPVPASELRLGVVGSQSGYKR
jgi:uncharacterized protein (DUF362 family)